MLRSTVRPRDATTDIEKCFVNIPSDDDSFGDSGYHDSFLHDSFLHDSGLCLDPYQEQQPKLGPGGCRVDPMFP